MRGSQDTVGVWEPRVRALAERVREAARGAMAEALAAREPERMTRAVRDGAGDVTFGVDVAAESEVERWFEQEARERCLSLLTEDAGWRHRGPARGGGTATLPGFDHGGPRIAIDPIDGTRALMSDLRSAWSVIGVAGPGEGTPRVGECRFGLVAEIPDSRGGRYRVLAAVRGRGARIELRGLASGRLVEAGPLVADADDRPDHGFFPFFAYDPRLRPAIARVEARFFERLALHEGADVRACWNDQYVSSGGQLALLALGTYRFVADLRVELGRRGGHATTTAKPYDVSGAWLVAREAGCVVSEVDGGELDFPLDATTPVGFVGYANAATARRLAPHLATSL